MSDTDNREFDIIIYGATGFTGRYVVEELSYSAARNPIKWAVAGRNIKKLNESLSLVQEYIGRGYNILDTPVIYANADDSSSIMRMCKKAKLILNCVGPYELRGGELIVSTCIETGTHQIDLCAEMEFLERIQGKYFQAARDNNVYIVQGCGFGFLPTDYGVSLVKQNFPGELNHVEYFLELKVGPKGKSTISLGTLSSVSNSGIKNLFNSLKLNQLLSTVFKKPLPPPRYPLKKRWPIISYRRDIESFVFPYIGPDRRTLLRSQKFRYEYLNDKPVQSHGYIKLKNFIFTLQVFIFCPLCFLMNLFTKGRQLVLKYPKILSGGLFSIEGPTREEIAENSTEITFFGKGWLKGCDKNSEPVSQIKLTINGPEAAYPLTARCMVQAGITLLEETYKLPLEGGVLTPGVAFEQTNLQKRLEDREIKFDIVKYF